MLENIYTKKCFKCDGLYESEGKRIGFCPTCANERLKELCEERDTFSKANHKLYDDNCNLTEELQELHHQTGSKIFDLENERDTLKTRVGELEKELNAYKKSLDYGADVTIGSLKAKIIKLEQDVLLGKVTKKAFEEGLIMTAKGWCIINTVELVDRYRDEVNK